jgi:glycosyltransferase involved in cell wall biosynthesis
MQISVVIRTFNAAARFAEVLSSLKGFADEIVAIDCGSNDETLAIARDFGAKIINQEWLGFAAQANEGFKHATAEWVFLLDQDEVVSDELRSAVLEELKNPRYDGYFINRQTIYFGEKLNYTWQPEFIFRLAKRGANARCEGADPHPKMICDGKIGRIDKKYKLLHYSYQNWRDQLRKSVDYAEVGARSMFSRGKKASLYKIIFSPLVAFLRSYLFKLGFLDGKLGLIAAGSSAIYTFMKYVFLYELDRDAGKAV